MCIRDSLWYWLQIVYILFTGGGDDCILVQYSREWYPDTGQLPDPRPVPDTAGHRGPLSLLCQKGLLAYNKAFIVNPFDGKGF